MKLAFIGGGVMGEAMIAGILQNRLTAADAITAADVSPSRQELLTERYGVRAVGVNEEAILGADLVVLAVKPQHISEVMGDLRGELQPNQLVMSIAAGVPIATLSGRLEHPCIVRVMPNTPAQIGQGMSVWTATSQVTEEQRETVGKILRSLGKEIYVEDERYVDMATAVSGSGPAYVFLIIEALIDAAVQIGLSRPIAQQLVIQTVLGSARFAESSGQHPAELKNMVTSPGGTTAEGLYRLEDHGVRAALIAAVLAGYEKAKTLGSS